MKIRRMITFSSCLSLLLSLLGSAEVTGDTTQQAKLSAVQQELMGVQKAFLDAQQRGDAQYVKNAVADDFMSIEADGNNTGRADFVGDVHPPEHPEPSAILYDFNVVQLNEDCIVVAYKAVFPGRRLERYQHLSSTWVKQAGQWKLKFQQSTLNLWSAHDLD